MNDEFPSNSIKEKQKNNKIIVKEPTTLDKASSLIFNESIESAAKGALWEILLPTIKRGVGSFFKSVIDRMLGLDETPYLNNNIISFSTGQKIDYSSRKRINNIVAGRYSREVVPMGQIIVPSKQQAEDVLDRLSEIIDRQGNVSKGHLYDILGLRVQSTDWKYGWTSQRDIREARILSDPDGYRIDMPPMQLI